MSDGLTETQFGENRPTRPDIGDEIQSICNKLGIPDRKVVAEITLTPTEARVLYFKLDQNGHKYVLEDGDPATRWIRRKVLT